MMFGRSRQDIAPRQAVRLETKLREADNLQLSLRSRNTGTRELFRSLGGNPWDLGGGASF